MRVAIVGGSGGIGGALARNLLRSGYAEALHATYYRNRPDPLANETIWSRVDLNSETSIADWCRTLGELDLVINAAGMLHTQQRRPEKTVAELCPEFFMQNISVNALASLMLAKHLRDNFDHGRPAIFSAVSARVGSIGDNRLGGWYSYRASKAALNMCLKTLSLEWKRTLPNVSVVALHPWTTDTSLSAPFQRNVPTGKLFSADYTADRLVEILTQISTKDTGKFLSYGGEELPW